MAAGDVFSNVNIPINSDGTIVQPAADVEIMLSAFFGIDALGFFQMVNSTGTSANMFVWSGYGGDWSQTRYIGTNVKLFFTNTQYIKLLSSPGNTSVVGYTGIQIK